jgi:hypothetical protein
MRSTTRVKKRPAPHAKPPIAKPAAKHDLLRSPVTEHFCAALLLFLILNVAFFSALWGDRTLMTSASETRSILDRGAMGAGPVPVLPRTQDPGAPGWQFEPGLMFTHNEFRAGRLPLWNPYVGYGAPWAAGMLSQPFFPLTALAALHPSPQTMDWFLVMRLWFAGIFTYFFLRFLVGFFGAIAGGIAFMLTGYFVLFLNIDHLSTEILIPLLFYGFERLLRDGAFRSKVIAAIAVFLSVVSGMPESTFLIVPFAAAYWLVRMLSDRRLRSDWMTHTGNFIGVNAVGFSLSAFLLLPFVEFMHNGIDSHRPSITGVVGGLGYISGYQYLLLYLTPMALGPLYSNILAKGTGYVPVLGYFGTAVTTAALAGVVQLVRRRSVHPSLHAFFFAVLVLMLLKQYGNPAVNWIGGLPVFNLINYPKYLQPLIGFSAAALAAFALEDLFRRRMPAGVVVGAAAAIIATGLLLAGTFRDQIDDADKFFYTNIRWLVLAPAAVCVCAIVCASRTRFRVAGAAGLITILSIELGFNYIYPVYYDLSSLSAQAYNPYRGAPFVDFLKRRTEADHARVFGREGFLYPNWSSAFGLYDVRYINGMNFGRMFDFVRAFLAPSDLGLHGDLADRFTGDGQPYHLSTMAEQRFLQLSSIRYIVGRTDVGAAKYPLVETVLTQNRVRIENERLEVRSSAFNLNGITREVLFEHPVTRRVALTAKVPSDKPWLRFTPAIDPTVGINCGDGVEFVVEVRDSRGVRELYRKYINPKANPQAQRWADDSVALKEYAGEEITLLFSTFPGRAGDSSCDWAGWGGLTLGDPPDASRPGTFSRIYSGEARIHEFSDPLPRASVFTRVRLAAAPEAALRTVRDLNTDAWKEVVIETDGVSSDTAGKLRTLAASDGATASAAEISHYDSQRVTIRASAEKPSVLMLTDSVYPGWNVYVDGTQKELLKANYLFRGVLLPPGTHQVEFRYQPRSYAYGGGISAVALACLIVWGRWNNRKQQNAKA